MYSPFIVFFRRDSSDKSGVLRFQFSAKFPILRSLDRELIVEVISHSLVPYRACFVALLGLICRDFMLGF